MPKFISVGGECKEVSVVNTTLSVKNKKEKPVEEVEVEVEEPINPTHDLNRDGAVDDKDASIAGEVLSAVKRRGRPKK